MGRETDVIRVARIVQVAGSLGLGHSPRMISLFAALMLTVAAGVPATPAPVPSPAGADAILAEVKRPGASAVLVNVWATWCSPCREEFPDLLHVARELEPKGLRLVLVSVDFAGAEEATTKFLTSQGVDFPTYVRTGKDETFVNGLEPQWSGAIPATFLYDADGKLVKFWEGKASYPVIKKRALKALEPKEAP
jgi:thiol-disulfide isomerase/thioredoxin